MIDKKLYLAYVPTVVEWPASCDRCLYAPVTARHNSGSKLCFTCMTYEDRNYTAVGAYLPNAIQKHAQGIRRSNRETDRIKQLVAFVSDNNPRIVRGGGGEFLGYSEDDPHPVVYDGTIREMDMITDTMNHLSKISIDSNWHWSSHVGGEGDWHTCVFCDGKYDATVFAYPCLHPVGCLYCYFNKVTQTAGTLVCANCDMPFSWCAFLHKYEYLPKVNFMRLVPRTQRDVLNVTLFPHLPLARHAGEDSRVSPLDVKTTTSAWGWIRVFAAIMWLYDYNDEWSFPFKSVLTSGGRSALLDDLGAGGPTRVPVKLRLPIVFGNAKCSMYDGINGYLGLRSERDGKACALRGYLLYVCKVLAAYNACLVKCNLFSNLEMDDPMGLPYSLHVQIPDVSVSSSIVNTLKNAVETNPEEALPCIHNIVRKAGAPHMHLSEDAVYSFASIKGYVYEVFCAVVAKYLTLMWVSHEESGIPKHSCTPYDSTFKNKLVFTSMQNERTVDRTEGINEFGEIVLDAGYDERLVYDWYTSEKSLGEYLKSFFPVFRKVEYIGSQVQINGILTLYYGTNDKVLDPLAARDWNPMVAEDWAMIMAHYLLYSTDVTVSQTYIDVCTGGQMRLCSNILKSVEKATYTVLESYFRSAFDFGEAGNVEDMVRDCMTYVYAPYDYPRPTFLNAYVKNYLLGDNNRVELLLDTLKLACMALAYRDLSGVVPADPSEPMGTYEPLYNFVLANGAFTKLSDKCVGTLLSKDVAVYGRDIKIEPSNVAKRIASDLTGLDENVFNCTLLERTLTSYLSLVYGKNTTGHSKLYVKIRDLLDRYNAHTVAVK